MDLSRINPIGIAVPFFFGLMAFEYLWSRRKRLNLYRLNDTISDLTCGMGDQLIGLVVKGTTLALYVFVYEAFHFMEMSIENPWTWVFGMVAVDLCYYAFHRFSHRVNWGWTSHVVHHQSEEYNLAVALRQPWFAQLFGWVFYLPLAILGLPAVVYATSYALNLIYQFWIHTRALSKLGPFEWVMNTPSHHRVHHGTNPAYVDKNYAGIFIIWDRMFGTFVEEDEEPTYGTLKPLRSWNPLVANTRPIFELLKAAAAQERWKHKLQMLWAPPGWTPEGVTLPAFPPPGRGYNARFAPGLGAYSVLHLIPVSIVMGLVIAFSAMAPTHWLVVGAVYVFWSAFGWAGFSERQWWAKPMEMSRLVVLVLATGLAGWSWGGLWWVVFGLTLPISVLSGAWFQRKWVAA